MKIGDRPEWRTQPITCVGVDITWWGGSKGIRISSRETIVVIRLSAEPTIAIEVVDLRAVPNPRGDDMGEPNYDRDGNYLVDALLQTIDRIAAPQEQVVIALDAPIEAIKRSGQSPRLKAVKKGESMGSIRRECEIALSQYAGNLPKEARHGWNRDLRIQSGSPIAPRITSVLKLLQQRGYQIIRNAIQKPTRGIIEIFPSQAIWALGILGHYHGASSQMIRAYKSKTDKIISTGVAFEIARHPLEGFSEVLCGNGGIDASIVYGWTNALAENAVACSPGRKSGEVHKGKGFDDPIDSGIAALTSVAYAIDRYHIFGDGTDGTIVGPGKLPGLA